VKLAAVAENLLERVLLALGLVPTPFLHTHSAMILSKAVSAATRLGVFDALAQRPGSASQVAASCGTDPQATENLLAALAGAGYLRRRGEFFSLRSVARRWLRDRGPRSLAPAMQWQMTEWQWLGQLEEFLLCGRGLDIHVALRPEQWRDYQRGTRSLAKIIAPEMRFRIPVPRGAKTMLDIGGAHGVYSAALCRREPDLRAVVLDLPQAIEHSADLLAQEGMGDRVVHHPGNVLEVDLGEQEWDVILMAQLAHHFNEDENLTIARKVSRALRPGGVYVVQDILRRDGSAGEGQIQALYHLFFSLTSQGGTWSFEQVAAWQREAGLHPRPPVELLTAPGLGLQVARK
jgi:2-polyprenyl-3-methyl-5-hydroxy-6-metoxy-1,4-benzoquinol methylase